MAGAGYKLFQSGAVLTASEVNTYLQEQTVMRFADAAARTTALSGVLAEGMVSYLDSTNAVEVYNGSAWVGITGDGDITGVTAGTGISGGGTTGTVTITNDMATTITAKGDIVAGTGNAAYDNLPAGSNGETLVADSSATTGLRWQATPSASNPVLNSAFDVWQRGTSFSLAASASQQYTADRWQTGTGTNQACTISRQATGDTTNLPNIQYCLRYQRNSGQTGTGYLALSQSFESTNSIPFAGKTITVSFYARRGANYSYANNDLPIFVVTGTGTDQNYKTGYTGSVTAISGTATLTTTWQRFAYSGTLASTATEMAIEFGFNPSGTAGTNDYYEVTGIQIDIGSVALPYRRSSATLAGELAACQRYYWRTDVTQSQVPYGSTWAFATTSAFYGVKLPVTMRVVPTSIDYNNLALNNGSVGQNITAITISSGSTKDFAYGNATVASGLTSGNSYALLGQNAASAYIGFGAEL